MVAWIRITANIATNTWCDTVSLGSPTNTGISTIALNEFGDAFANDWDDSGASGQYATTGSVFTANNWVCVLARFTNDGKQSFYTSKAPTTLISGASSQLNACSYDNLTVGWQTTRSFASSTPTSSTNVHVAEVAVWQDTLSQSEAQMLFNGANPLTIRPATLQYYHPLRTDLNDYGPQHTALTPIGGAVATFTDHPPVSPVPVVNPRLGQITQTPPIAAKQKPYGPVQINWNHRLSNGLIGYYLLGLGGPPRDLVTGTQATAVTAGGIVKSGIGPNGPEDIWGGANGSGWNLGSGRLVCGLSNWSIVAGHRLNVIQNGNTLYCERAATGNDVLHFEASNGVGAPVFLQFRSDANVLFSVAGNIQATLNDFIVDGVSFNGTNFRALRNGVLDWTFNYSSGSTFTNASSVRSIGYDTADAGRGAEFISFVALYNRTLSDAEHMDLALNPYSLLEPLSNPVPTFARFVPGAVLASTATATSSVTAALTNFIQLAATPTATSTSTADLTNHILFASASIANSSATADLTNHILFASAASATSSANNALTNSIQFVSNASGSSNATAALTNHILFASTSTATSSATADLTIQPRFQVAAVATSSATADLTTSIVLLTNAVATSSATNDLTNQILLASNAIASSNLVGELIGGPTRFLSNAVASSSATGTLTNFIQLASNAVADSNALSPLTNKILFSSNAIADSNASLTLGHMAQFEFIKKPIAFLTGVVNANPISGNITTTIKKLNSSITGRTPFGTPNRPFIIRIQ